MILNEQSQKIDMNLENTCKKFEKVALESKDNVGAALPTLPFNDGEKISK